VEEKLNFDFITDIRDRRQNYQNKKSDIPVLAEVLCERTNAGLAMPPFEFLKFCWASTTSTFGWDLPMFSTEGTDERSWGKLEELTLSVVVSFSETLD
jgi:hypothetical protein